MSDSHLATDSRVDPVKLRSRIAAALAYLVRLPARLVVGLLRLYQLVVSPLYGSTCRFYPSCSQYALLSVQRHGVVRGTRLAAWRLLRCNPWNPGGVDDVPPGRVPAHPAHPHH
ncbi:membrane protein insertion efficiency factor YidD [Pengzhenrongella sp.]|uniref:membrane protein insertion efficiency factor YidD n=1 Tax=Pengzhenrongella sp. TaxID=2888820 RepID=UPI002F95B17D